MTQQVTRDETVVAAPLWITGLAWVTLPAGGALLGWLLPRAARWLTSLRWAPMKGPAELISSLPQPQVTLGAVAVGVLGGLILAFIAVYESLRAVVRRDLVVLTRAGTSTTVDRADVAAVFVERERLVLLDRAGRELAREPYDLGGTAMAEAFTGHGWPWRADGDPYRHAYRRWVPDLPGLPAGADALFKARARALERGDREDAASLRADLARLGVVVRDEKGRQHYRCAGTPAA